MSLMENMTVASVSMGNVKGILKKIQEESEITTSYFIYSSETGIRVRGWMTSDIHTFNVTLHDKGVKNVSLKNMKCTSACKSPYVYRF